MAWHDVVVSGSDNKRFLADVRAELVRAIEAANCGANVNVMDAEDVAAKVIKDMRRTTHGLIQVRGGPPKKARQALTTVGVAWCVDPQGVYYARIRSRRALLRGKMSPNLFPNPYGAPFDLPLGFNPAHFVFPPARN